MRVSNFSILTFLFVTLLSFIAMSTQRADAAACTRNADGEIIDGDIDPSCTVTPDAVYFPIYKFGLCENVPTYDNYQSSCTMLFDNATAAVVEVTPTSNFNLAENLTITEGVYKAAIVLVGNTIQVRHSEVFDEDWDGIDDTGADSTGKYCATRLDSGSEDDFDSNLDCSNTPIEAGIFSETEGAYHTAGACTIVAGANQSNLSFTTASGSTTVCGMLNADTLETYTGGDTDATRQLVTQAFTSDVTISPSTTALEIAFKVTNMLSIENVIIGGVSTDYLQAYLDGFDCD